nr:MAG TPA: hypothetical protein [Caudoviricetes sp.]
MGLDMYIQPISFHYIYGIYLLLWYMLFHLF